MSAAKPKESPDLGAIFDGHMEKEFEQNREGGMTDRKTIDSHLAETVGPNHEDEMATGTQKNKRVVKELYGAFGRGDMAAVRALVAEDVIWHLPGTVPHYSGTYKGPSSVADFFQNLYANVGIEAFEPCEFVAEADHVLVIGWTRGRVKFDNRWVMAFTVRDGRIAKFEEYADTQALAAAHDVSTHHAGVLSNKDRQ
jgi:ketosteroid isomerase-like protein